MHPQHFFVVALISTFALLLNWKLETHFHRRRLSSKKLRIHVNGIRGKSTVTRLVAGLLRAAGYQTFAKTTGSAACTIDTAGNDHAILRNGSPTILEQVQIIRNIDSDVDALVIECMAINPEYQRVCESKLIRSHVGIITNVREDHQEILGESLGEIANSLLATCPENGTLITAEQNPQLLAIFQRVADCKNTTLIIADPEDVSDKELDMFQYVAFKDNVSIGLAVAHLLGIDRPTALAGMACARPDPGALTISFADCQQRHITWADMFAVNDRESVIAAVKRIEKITRNGATKIGLLNNRSDREYRAIQFARIAALDLNLNYIALLGAYEKQIEAELIRYGIHQNRILRLGESSGLLSEALISRIVESVDSRELLMIGMVNIHTPQADSIRQYFANQHEKTAP